MGAVDLVSRADVTEHYLDHSKHTRAHTSARLCAHTHKHMSARTPR